jgi:hypothetical protein
MSTSEVSSLREDLRRSATSVVAYSKPLNVWEHRRSPGPPLPAKRMKVRAGYVIGEGPTREVDLRGGFPCGAPLRIPNSYAKLVFLHPMVSTGHVVHSGAFGPRNINALFFMLGWDRKGLHKKHNRTHYAELVFFHPVASVAHVVHNHASGA